nr:haloacid dehalogenase-like hydrolase [uncultured bacterium]
MKPEWLEVALFDLGGVLVEFTGVPTLLSWIDGQMRPEELWRHWLTSPNVRAFETGAMEPEDFAELLIAELDLPVQRADFLDSFTHWPNGLFPGAMELISEIPRPIVRATLSNSNSLHWPRLMTEMGLSEAFDFHFASHLMGKIKPDKEAFEHVMSSLGSIPESILFLDDNQLNVDAALSLGIRAFRVQGVEEARFVMEEIGALRHSSA